MKLDFARPEMIGFFFLNYEKPNCKDPRGASPTFDEWRNDPYPTPLEVVVKSQ